jgi:hypothetical protein
MVLWRDVEPARSIKVNGRTPGIRYFVAFLFDGGAQADRVRERLGIEPARVLAANCSAILTFAGPAPAINTRLTFAHQGGGGAQCMLCI